MVLQLLSKPPCNAQQPLVRLCPPHPLNGIDCIGVQGATAVFGRAKQRPWLCHPPCLPSGRLRRLPRHRRRLAAENSEGPLGAPTGGLARPQGESRLTPAEPENAASVPVGTPSGVVSPLYTDTLNDESVLISFIIHERRAKSKARRTQEVFWFDGISHPALCEKQR